MCLHRGTSFSPASDSHLLTAPTVDRSASALNQLDSPMAVNSQLREILYRVSVHGTVAQKSIPAFHTQKVQPTAATRSRSFAHELASRARTDTGFSYTVLPTSSARDHRQVIHTATGAPYTEVGVITGGSYTSGRCNYLESQNFFQANCTKPSCTKNYNIVDAFRFAGVGQ